MLLSVHPRFAAAILAGEKTVEVRRQRVAVPPGTAVLLYATAPEMALVGTVRVTGVHVAPPGEVWSAHGAATGISRAEFDTYMTGAARASGLTLTDPVALDEPVPLSALRASGPFHPPQSYRYLDGAELAKLSTAAPTADTVLQALAHEPVPG